MSKPHLVLINTINTPHDDVTEEFEAFKESLSPGTQMSMFDIIEHEEDYWFTQAIIKLEEGEIDD